jgi:hypothetical protein
MNAIKLGNTFSGLILAGMVVTFGFIQPQTSLNNLTDEVLNNTYQHLIHFSQPSQAKIVEVIPPIQTATNQPVSGTPEVTIISPPTQSTELSSPQPSEIQSEPSGEATIESSIVIPEEPPVNIEPEPSPPIPEAPSVDEGKQPAEEEQPIPELPKSTIFGGPYFSPELNPLTGLVAEDLEKLNRRPAMIKVSNYPRYGRPHAGLSFADMVFEYYIGEEANRFLALYYSQDAPKIGPLRSGRLVDAQLTNLYQGILSYGNADPKVEKVLAKELGSRAIPFSHSPCPVACGTADTHTVAGVFTNSAELSKLATKMGVAQNRPDLTGTYFDSNPPQSDQYAVRIGVEYSFRDRGEWHYDPESSTYLRWIESMGNDNKIYMTPLPDRLTGEQLRFSNVIIIFAKYTEYAPTLHDVAIWNNFDGQRAVVFRDGLMIEGSWKVEDHEHPIQFFDPSGKPIPLKPGNTWIVIAGQSSTFDQTGPGKWEMMFHLP